MRRIGWHWAALLLLAPDARGADLAGALAGLSGARVLDHIKVLASDEFEGRGPGTPGEDRTVDYLIGQFRGMGLAPGNPDGTYTQAVPLVGFQAVKTSGSLRFPGGTVALATSDDWVGVSRRYGPAVERLRPSEGTVDGTVAPPASEVVFVGYGVVAPEFGWDDYKGLDVRGKTVIMLINDPPVAEPADPSKLDPATFGGKAMTYYGRWTYKYEIASAKGAAACLIVHESVPAGYPYPVVVGELGPENFDLLAPGGNADRVAVEGWLALETARKVFASAGRDLGALKESARRRDFRPVALGGTAEFSVENRYRRVESRNVVARLAGSDPALRAEQVVYTAHWDHLGRDPALKGDQIFNGAADNASGVAALLEIARGFASLDTPPRRSILFLAVTAEEKGLLGARYYAEHPLYPLASTLADINMDVINLWGPTRDIVSVGLGNTTLDDLLIASAQAQGRTVGGDPEPEKGMFYRSDHFEFARQGVPALNAKAGVDYVGKPAGYGQQKRDQYTRDDYHKVTDEVKPDWDLAGAVQDMQLLMDVGDRVARGKGYPAWKPGTEFKARREAMLRDAGR